MTSPRDALLLGAESLRAEAESIRSGLQPLSESDIAAAREAEAAAASLEAQAETLAPSAPDEDPPVRPYVRIVREVLTGDPAPTADTDRLCDLVRMLVGIATVDPTCTFGSGVSAADDTRNTLAEIAESLGEEPDPIEIQAAYQVLAAIGRVVASALLPDATYCPDLETRLGADIVSDLDRAADEVRVWFGFLHG